MRSDIDSHNFAIKNEYRFQIFKKLDGKFYDLFL